MSREESAMKWENVTGWHKGYDEDDARQAATEWAEAEPNIMAFEVGAATPVNGAGSREHGFKASYSVVVMAQFRPRKPKTIEDHAHAICAEVHRTGLAVYQVMAGGEYPDGVEARAIEILHGAGPETAQAS